MKTPAEEVKDALAPPLWCPAAGAIQDWFKLQQNESESDLRCDLRIRGGVGCRDWPPGDFKDQAVVRSRLEVSPV